ncbi:MAG: NAD(+)/NADH kinase [Deltaproteobacteria bacterium]|nr:NAD(+)/NADH kinase [Deltaproteobacteria bacterium]
MKKIGLVIKLSNPEAIKLGCDICEWVSEKGGAVYTSQNLLEVIRPATSVPAGDLSASIDVMVVLGGDGTMLSAARMLDGRKVPILGINMGGLGFLTASTLKEVYPLLERIMRDDYVIEERMMLSVSLNRKNETVAKHKVLNDVVIRGALGRLVRLETKINNEYVNTYRADGLIIATPTGSTAYSLSANGPILYPTIHSIIVAPICPFNLTNRPVVIPDWMSVDVTVIPDQMSVGLMLDGQVDVSLEAGDLVKVKRAEASVYLIKYEGKSYFDILRERLMWEIKPPCVEPDRK